MKSKALTKLDYLKELVEDVVSAASDYGADPTERNEAELAILTDMLYNALQRLKLRL